MPTFVSDILSKAARSLGAIQLGQSLSANESAELLSTWQQLIDSFGLSKANLHTVRQDSYALVSGKPSYTIGFDPRVIPISVSAATNASPTVLTLAAPHGLVVGRTNAVVIAGGAGNWQAVNGAFTATVLTSTTLSIAVDATTFGALTGTVSLQLAGEWSSVRPTRISEMNLVLSAGLFTPIRLLTQREEADIMFLNVTAPPHKAYNDENSPLSTVTFWPTPDSSAYKVNVWSEQALQSVGDLAVTDQIALPQGYERFWVTSLAVEAGPLYSIEPSPTLLNNAADARSKVQSKNRKSPLLVNDAALLHQPGGVYNWKIGLNQ